MSAIQPTYYINKATFCPRSNDVNHIREERWLKLAKVCVLIDNKDEERYFPVESELH
jgi:hypothetical protein